MGRSAGQKAVFHCNLPGFLLDISGNSLPAAFVYCWQTQEYFILVHFCSVFIHFCEVEGYIFIWQFVGMTQTNITRSRTMTTINLWMFSLPWCLARLVSPLWWFSIDAFLFLPTAAGMTGSNPSSKSITLAWLWSFDSLTDRQLLISDVAYVTDSSPTV